MSADVTERLDGRLNASSPARQHQAVHDFPAVAFGLPSSPSVTSADIVSSVFFGCVETEPPPACPAAADRSEQEGGGLLFSRLPERLGIILGRVIGDISGFLVALVGIVRDGRAGR